MTIVTTDAPITPLRQRMQHDMMMRGLGRHTQQDYIRHVRRFAAFLERPPDTATEEDIRRFQLSQHERGVSASRRCRVSMACGSVGGGDSVMAVASFVGMAGRAGARRVCRVVQRHSGLPA